MKLHRRQAREFVIGSVARQCGIDENSVTDETLVPDIIGMITVAQFEFDDAPTLFNLKEGQFTVAEAIDTIYPYGQEKGKGDE